MRIHTDKLSTNDLYAATPAGVDIDECMQHGSRSRERAYEVRLIVWNGGKGTSHPYRRNSGQYGADRNGYAATYDEWGYWLDALFDLDPKMIAGPYKSRADFYEKTWGKYDRQAV